MDALGDITGKFVVCLFLSYVVGFVNSALPRGFLRHTFLATAGMVTCAFVFGAPWMLLLVSTGVVYVLLVLGSLIGGIAAKFFSIVAVVMSFDIMFSRHILRANAEATGLDDCAAQMVLFLKLAHLAMAVYDGAGDLDRLKTDSATGKGFVQKAAQSRLTRALRFVPFPWAVLGYTFNPTTAMAGPAFDFSVYTLGQDGCLIDDGKLQPLTKAQQARVDSASRWPRMLQGLGMGLVLMGLFSAMSAFFPIESLFDSELAAEKIGFFVKDAKTVTFLTDLLMGSKQFNPVLSVLFIWFWLSIIQMGVRTQYYGSWVVAEGASAAAGLGLDPSWVRKTAGEPAKTPLTWSENLVAYDKAKNIEPLAVETATDYKTAINKWNKHTQQWLAECVYKRAPTAFGINTVAVFLVSALWHGVFPGYFLSLPVMAIAVPAFGAAYNVLRSPIEFLFGAPETKTAKATSGILWPLGGILRWLVVVGLLNYFMAPFMLLNFAKGMNILARTYFFGHWFILICIVVAVLGAVLGMGGKTRASADKVKRS
jgi:hypothetical protein